MKIFVDIDGILTNETEGHDYKNRTPNYKNIKKNNSLFLDHKIILYTSRYWRDFFVTKKWLKKYDVKYNKIIFRKPKYDLLIDDKSINNMGVINV